MKSSKDTDSLKKLQRGASSREQSSISGMWVQPGEGRSQSNSDRLELLKR